MDCRSCEIRCKTARDPEPLDTIMLRKLPDASDTQRILELLRVHKEPERKCQHCFVPLCPRHFLLGSLFYRSFEDESIERVTVMCQSCMQFRAGMAPEDAYKSPLLHDYLKDGCRPGEGDRAGVAEASYFFE